MGVGTALQPGSQTYWGTFTEHSCAPARFGCHSVGTWVSDDESITRTSIALDGKPNADGTVSASYTPTGFNNDLDNNIVHTQFGTSARLWLPWTLAALMAAIVAVQSLLWRRRDGDWWKKSPRTRSSGRHEAE
jgi:hypothetical protein